MADVWEQIVETYLASNRGMFLNPQYLVGEKGNGVVSRLLALDFPAKEAWMVEVTKTPREKLLGKIDQFTADLLPRIRDQLVRNEVILADAHWGIGCWVFTPRAWETRVKERMERAHIVKYLVTPLEDAVPPM